MFALILSALLADSPGAPPALADTPRCKCPCQSRDCAGCDGQCAAALKAKITKAEPATKRVVSPKPASPAKRWYQLTNEPGVLGYGALNSRGDVIVEQRRRMAAPVPGCVGGRCSRR
jgi:hypothetical protein